MKKLSFRLLAETVTVVRSTTKPRFGEVFSYWFRCWWYLSHAQPIVSYVD